MPGDRYSARFTVIDVHRRRGFLTLTLQPRAGTREVRLPLSRWLFDLPEIREGNELFASGKRNLAGVYIDRIQVYSRPGGLR